MSLQHFRSSETVDLLFKYATQKKSERKKTKEKIYSIELPLIRAELANVDIYELAIPDHITHLSSLQNIYDAIMNTSASYKEIEKTVQFTSYFDRGVFTQLTGVNIEIFRDFEKIDATKKVAF